jgi:diketogulonate reductase-like aldo/keto reductase
MVVILNLEINSKLKLNNGIEMPLFGLGTYDLRGERGIQAAMWALEIGYRLIDTASFYNNEIEMGKAIKKSNIPREEIFITSKVWNTEQGYDNALKAFDRSLNRLDTDYIDLYLVHWPVVNLRDDTWRALEKIASQQKALAIGVSNYTIRHLEGLLEKSNTIPTVNQFENSPFLYQKELIDYCKSKNIAVEAYTPLTKGQKFNNKTIQEMGKSYNKTPAQIFIRWGLQHQIIQIPKSGNKEHLLENASVFDFHIKQEDMAKLDGINENYRIIDDPHLID